MKGQGKKRATTRARARAPPPRAMCTKKNERERERERPFFWRGGRVVRGRPRRKNRVVVKKSHFRAVSLFSLFSLETSSPFFLSLFPSLSLFEMCLSGSSHYESRDALFFNPNERVFGVVEEKTEEEDAR